MFKEKVAVGTSLYNIGLCDQQAWSLNRLFFQDTWIQTKENFHKDMMINYYLILHIILNF